MAMLEVESLCVTYSGVRAVDSVSVRVDQGQAIGLIGPNGAGKTSFLDGVTGLTPAQGRVRFDGHDISRLPAHVRARAGFRRTWQSVELFDDLTVGENLAVSAAEPGFGSALSDLIRAQREAWAPRVKEALGMFGVEGHFDAKPQALPLGVRKLVGVARSVVSRPRAIGMDEPAAGLDSRESRALSRHLRSVVDAGIGVLLIDHDMDLVLGLCDYIYVLDFGKLIAEGVPAEVRSNSDVRRAYLGR
jgi:branched-chain amino acid transport system ATP-binding protein